MDNEAFSHLTALTHLDGRNADKIKNLRDYFSEFAWMKTRILVLIKWLEFLLEAKILKSSDLRKKERLTGIYEKFSLFEAQKIQEKEKITNHDLRAIELYLQDKLAVRFVGFGLGSEDINNIALRIQIRAGYQEVLLTELLNLAKKLTGLVEDNKKILILARTHGQPASVTTLGKELGLHLYRFVNELSYLNKLEFSGKISGEVGNYNSLDYVFSQIDWLSSSKRFMAIFNLRANLFSTQINPYDDLIVFFDSLRRLNNLLLGLTKDIWLYIMLDYLKVVKVEKEVGSAGLPHKVNPIYFEGAEGGLELANSLLEFFSRKLSYSRLQRDFSDSTVRRNLVLAFASSLLSYQSLNEALVRLEVNREKINQDLNGHFEVFSEGLRTLLSLKGQTDAYEKVKQLTRGMTLSKMDLHRLIEQLALDLEIKKKLKIDNLGQYAGLSVKLTALILKKTRFQLRKIR